MPAANLYKIDCLTAQQAETLQQWFKSAGAQRNGATQLRVALEPVQAAGLQQDFGVIVTPAARP